jgi:hypothetical protein
VVRFAAHGMATLGTIDRIERPSYEQFRDAYLEARVPVLVAGALDQWPAMRRWDLAHIGRAIGSRRISPVIADKGRWAVDVREGMRTEEMDFAAYRAEIESGDVHHYLRLALEGSFADLLADEYETPIYCRKRIFMKKNLWIGSTDSSSGLHYDMMHNVVAQIAGRRRVVLFAPEEALAPQSRSRRGARPRALPELRDRATHRGRDRTRRPAVHSEGLVAPLRVARGCDRHQLLLGDEATGTGARRRTCGVGAGRRAHVTPGSIAGVRASAEDGSSPAPVVRPLPRVAASSRSEFFEGWVAPRQPVVLAGLVEGWPAVARWTVDYLGAAYPTVAVTTAQVAGGVVVMDRQRGADPRVPRRTARGRTRPLPDGADERASRGAPRGRAAARPS